MKCWVVGVYYRAGHHSNLAHGPDLRRDLISTGAHEASATLACTPLADRTTPRAMQQFHLWFVCVCVRCHPTHVGRQHTIPFGTRRRISRDLVTPQFFFFFLRLVRACVHACYYTYIPTLCIHSRCARSNQTVQQFKVTSRCCNFSSGFSTAHHHHRPQKRSEEITPLSLRLPLFLT